MDILILNAGVFALPYTLTEDGYESTFQICHLSHFYLTKLLEPEILNASFPRIIVVSSESHRFVNNLIRVKMYYHVAKLIQLLIINKNEYLKSI